MVRLLLFCSIVLLYPLATKGQVSVSIDPTTFVMTGNPNQTDVVFHILVSNTSNQTINLFWSKRMTNHPAEWFSWICDKTTCYTPNFNSCPLDRPNTLGGGESFDISVHMNPVLVEGSGDYELNIIDEGGNVLYTIEGEILISNTTAINEAGSAELSVFPNPTTDFFQVNGTPGLKSIELFNIIGNKVRLFNAAPQKQYYVGDLNDGIYLVRMVSANNKVLKTIRLSKR
ncbi:MAG: T9SS type A sorting domain-containing protein [Saprospiraceae bacterium]